MRVIFRPSTKPWMLKQMCHIVHVRSRGIPVCTYRPCGAAAVAAMRNAVVTNTCVKPAVSHASRTTDRSGGPAFGANSVRCSYLTLTHFHMACIRECVLAQRCLWTSTLKLSMQKSTPRHPTISAECIQSLRTASLRTTAARVVKSTCYIPSLLSSVAPSNLNAFLLYDTDHSPAAGVDFAPWLPPSSSTIAAPGLALSTASKTSPSTSKTSSTVISRD